MISLLLLLLIIATFPATGASVNAWADFTGYFFASDTHLAATYPSKIVIYERPEGATLKGGRPYVGEVLFPFEKMKQVKTIEFKRPIHPVNTFDILQSGDKLLVCSFFVVRPRKVSPTSKSAIRENDDQFCGVMAIDGTTAYSFPIKQRTPDRIVQPLMIAAGGKKAIIAIGELGTDDADSGYEFVKNFQEVWIWEYPGTLRKIPKSEIPAAEGWVELRRSLVKNGL